MQLSFMLLIRQLMRFMIHIVYCSQRCELGKLLRDCQTMWQRSCRFNKFPEMFQHSYSNERKSAQKRELLCEWEINGCSVVFWRVFDIAQI